MTPLIIAHRTCPPFAPENSLEGMRIAAEQGADGIEVDLRLSLDGNPFLMHDNTMRRTTGYPLPLELTPAAIVRKQRLANGEPVPSLDEALDALPAGRLLAIDVKTPWAVFALVKAIKRRGMEKRSFVWCTSALDVRYAVARLPGAEVAYLKDTLSPRGKRDFVWRAKRLGAHAISAHWLAVDAAIVSMAHDYGLHVYSYHSGYELLPNRLEAGLDGLITDFPKQTREKLEGLTHAS